MVDNSNLEFRILNSDPILDILRKFYGLENGPLFFSSQRPGNL